MFTKKSPSRTVLDDFFPTNSIPVSVKTWGKVFRGNMKKITEIIHNSSYIY